MNARWTERERDTLRKMRADGYDNKAIGQRLNRPNREVCREAMRLGLDDRRGKRQDAA